MLSGLNQDFPQLMQIETTKAETRLAYLSEKSNSPFGPISKDIDIHQG